jgi:arabinan endo-1,5-alpha-L-arabinosidase
VRCGDEYWLFATGRGVPSHRSKDLVTWEPGARVFPDRGPAWVPENIPLNRNGNDFWAPEVIRLGDRYLVYYSVSSWGKNTSVIGLATNATLAPTDPAYAWKDEGVVMESVARRDDFNAIDPAPFLDADGRLWLAFGSFWGGIKMVELDAQTGRRLAADSPVHSLAWKEQIEGPYIFRRGKHYYLLVAWGWCCRGVASTYNVRIGRADRVTGPYLDRDGRDMRRGGGTLVLGNEGPFIGPGQPSILAEPDESGRTDRGAERYHLICHFYDATRRGRSTLAIRPLEWDADGWPVVGPEPTR